MLLLEPKTLRDYNILDCLVDKVVSFNLSSSKLDWVRRLERDICLVRSGNSLLCSYNIDFNQASFSARVSLAMVERKGGNEEVYTK